MEDLTAMGFDSNSIAIALSRCGGNVEAALDFLLSSSNSFDQFQIEQIEDEDTVIPLSISQYTFSEAGSSACTAIAGSVLKLLLEQLEEGFLVTNKETLCSAVFSGVQYYQSLPPAQHSHLSVDELGPLMITLESSDAVFGGPIQGMLSSHRSFEELFDQARSRATSTGKYIGIIITKPPETVCVILPPSDAAAGGSVQNEGKFIFFDSHSRPQLGYSGSYMVVSSTQAGIIQRLRAIFPPLPIEFGAAGGQNDYMQLMYNMFEGAVFQCR